MTRRSPFKVDADAPRTFPEWIRHRARLGTDRPALEVCGDARTYAELDERTDRLAAGFAAIGLKPGEHAALMMSNSIENVEAWFGLQKAGVVEVPVHTAARGEALRYVVDRADARALVVDASLLGHVAAVAQGLPRLEHVVVRRDEVHGGAAAALPSRVAIHDLIDLAELEAAAPQLRVDPSDTSVILHTSGTTGPPKGVVLSHDAVLHLTRHIVWLMGYTGDDRLYTAFPLFHNNAKYTSVCAALECGGSLAMDDRFPVSSFWPMARERGITAFNYMGALLMMLHKREPDAADADHRVRIAFGAPCPVEIWPDFERRFGVSLVEVYGMTECPMATENLLEDRRIGSAGKASISYEVRVVDDDDEPVAPGEPGQIVVRPRRAGALFTEYYRRPEDTVRAWTNLWFHTGDRGRMDEDGFLFFIDRMADCIRRRGENISSWEVESTLSSHPGVLEAAAYGVPSELSESEVMVAVVRRDGASPGPAELLDHCRDRLARHAIPRYVRFLEALPRNHAERVEKLRLREQAVTADTWDREASGYELPR